ncbi:MAG: AMP-binding protein [Pseudomonadales bacterium]
MNLGLIAAKWAALAPAREAIIDIPSGRRVTFSELDLSVRRLANGLLGAGELAHGDRVVILARNCVELVEVVLAAARAGLIAVPLNWRLGVPELERIVLDAQPGMLLFGREFESEAKALAQGAGIDQLIGFDDSSPLGYDAFKARASDAELPKGAQPAAHDPCLILYTGGTTGDSKGVLHSHHSLYMGMLNQTVAERIVPSDVYMMTGQMFHIPVVLALNYLAHGCPLVLINFEPRLALEVIERERVSAFLGITTMLNWMLAVEDFAGFDLSSLRNIQYGGGPMPATMIRTALASFPCTLIQGYGQTEGVTMTFLSQEDHARALAGEHPERLRSCGREGFVTRVQVVNHAGQPVPRDGTTVGEIIVRSEANMLGYWGRPELTAQTLRDGWMWTGDLATWDVDGYVFIVDRAKDMIISGGENIYSAQVENAIHRHPAVLEAAVIGVPDDEWGEAVKAIVALKPGMQATADEIIAVAREHLASYQKPRSVDFVDALPKAPTGKILKRALRDRYWSERDRKV